MTARRTLPSDLEAETKVLGALLDGQVPADMVELVFTMLEPEHFASVEHRLVYAAVREVHRRDGVRDVVLVRAELERRGQLGQLRGGPVLLTDLLAAGSSGLEAPAMAQRMVELHARRRAIVAAHDVIETAKLGPDWRAPAGRLDELLRGPSGATAASPSIVRGGEWMADAPPGIPAVWGVEGVVAWAEGEPMLLVGPQGVGKTTLVQQLILARIGIVPPVILGLEVAPPDRPVLYVAADRPRQAQRSMRRMVGEVHFPELDGRLIVHEGPLPVMLTTDPTWLAGWAADLGVGTVILDSLKDVATDITKDEGGNRINLAFQHVVGAGIDLLSLHHQRKGERSGADPGRKPKTLEDVYGSTFITAGCGSVLLLWGDPGSPVVELSHLKQPAEDVGPMQVDIDHLTGAMSVVKGTDPLGLLRASPGGITVPEMARRLYGKTERADRERARRTLEGLVRQRLAHRRPGAVQVAGGTPADLFVATDSRLQEAP